MTPPPAFLTLQNHQVERALLTLQSLAPEADGRVAMSASALAQIVALTGEVRGDNFAQGMATLSQVALLRAVALANTEEWIAEHNVNLSIALLPQVAEIKRSIASRTNFSALHIIASAIEQQEHDYVVAWEELSGPSPTPETPKAILAAAAVLNAFIEPLIGRIASATGNSADVISATHRPTDPYGVYFSTSGAHPPSSFLRRVARFQTFNQEAVRQTTENMIRNNLADRATPSVPGSVAEAVEAIVGGNVPHVNFADAKVDHSSDSLISPLEGALLKAGVLQPYSSNRNGQLTSTVHFAFVVHGRPGHGPEFTFWPADKARHYVTRSPQMLDGDEDASSDTPMGG